MSENTAEKPPVKTPKNWRGAIWYLLIGGTLILLATTFFSQPKTAPVVSYSRFLTDLNAGQISEVTIKPIEKLITAKSKANQTTKTYFLDESSLMTALQAQGTNITITPPQSGWVLSAIFQALLPFLIIGVLWFFILRQAQGANSQAMSFGRSRAKDWKKGDRPKVRFKDVAGVDEAVQELEEIVSFLKKPAKYHAIGAKIPKGVLLMGPPGTGKTMLAKAIAGEADVPFFSISGSDFVEMFVGVGASRVRDLFVQAKKNHPSIIFIDEIDAVGRQRGAGLGGGHDEREQTLNQLLVEMDGFDDEQTVIVIAATNRSDVLDPALLRPGRFDRQVVVPRPDLKGRAEILKIHAKKRKLSKDINLDTVAKGTSGFTGADLANLINESALLAARHNKKIVTDSEIQEAIERVVAGPERKSRIMTEIEKETVAYHEVGHAIVAYCCTHTDPVHKISILPRGSALGYTLQLPENDKFLVSKSRMLDEIKILMGGRIAEELTFGEITSGASNDIERATKSARDLVCLYGMSEKLGPRKYGKSQETIFLGRDYSDHSSDYSPQTAQLIDAEIQSVIDKCYAEASTILKTHKEKLGLIAKELLKTEVMDNKKFVSMMKASA